VTVTVAMMEVVYALRASRMFSAETSDASGMRGTRSWRSRIVGDWVVADELGNDRVFGLQV
jgi:hypothetical protein